jgi:tRNA(fMet)-specific endonuclease VapC
MPLYLLDTNILSDAIKNPHGACAEKIASAEAGSLCTSIVVAAELRFGAAKKGAPELSRRINQLLEAIEIAPLGAGSDLHYANLRCDLERQGLTIGANDMLIAAHALAMGAVLVTDNIREFSRIVDLTIQNWLRPC